MDATLVNTDTAMELDGPQSLLERLPTEIRLMIYNELLFNGCTDDSPVGRLARVMPAACDYYEYEYLKRSADSPCAKPSPSPVLKIRTEEPSSYEQRRPLHRRTSFKIRSDRFRARCMSTTYHLLSAREISTTFLLSNARIHAEAAGVLYSSHVFDFDTHVEAIVPFFSDLTALARSCVRAVRIVKRALPYEKEFDRAEWSSALSYLAENVPLQSLSLGIVAGMPGPDGWQMVPPYQSRDFELLKELDGMEWIKDVLAIQGLERLHVDAVVEHCPPPMSAAMANYIRFSASIDCAFAEFLTQKLLA
ncbi:hypothetical protein H2203_007353 [Taxawa tesnikishii (nom. ined.)]|nr:hypothetical protein H2203_007353 [Dothideales sp. JES 119]